MYITDADDVIAAQGVLGYFTRFKIPYSLQLCSLDGTPLPEHAPVSESPSPRSFPLTVVYYSTKSKTVIDAPTYKIPPEQKAYAARAYRR